MIRLAHAHQGLEAQIHASLAPPAVARADLGQRPLERGREFGAVGLDQLPGVRDRFA